MKLHETSSKTASIKRSKSMPITGNYTASTPIAISTYFFQHTPRNQPNLLKSHSDHTVSHKQKKEKDQIIHEIKTEQYTENKQIEQKLQEISPKSFAKHINKKEI